MFFQLAATATEKSETNRENNVNSAVYTPRRRKKEPIFFSVHLKENISYNSVYLVLACVKNCV